MTRALAVVAAATLASLAVIDGTFASTFVTAGIVQAATWFEALVFALQLAKTVLVLGIRDLRNAGGFILVDVYGAELFLLPVLLMGYLGLRLAAAPMVMGELIVGWVVGVAVGGSVVIAYRLGAGMLRGGRLMEVLPLGVAATEVGVILVDGTGIAAAARSGLAGVASGAFFGRGGAAPAGVPVYVAVAVVYISLLGYAIGGRSEGRPTDLNRGLSLAVGATLLGAAWAALSAFFAANPDLMFVPPAAGGIALSWWVARGK